MKCHTRAGFTCWFEGKNELWASTEPPVFPNLVSLNTHCQFLFFFIKKSISVIYSYINPLIQLLQTNCYAVNMGLLKPLRVSCLYNKGLGILKIELVWVGRYGYDSGQSYDKLCAVLSLLCMRSVKTLTVMTSVW